MTHDKLSLTTRGLAPEVGLAHGRKTVAKALEARARSAALKQKVLGVLYCMGGAPHVYRENDEVGVGAECFK